MVEAIDELTMNYEEDGVLLVKETGKAVLSKGAWTTIMFRYQNWDKATSSYGKEAYSIRRYQKRGGEYIQKSKFTVSSRDQAEKIVSTLQQWLKEDEKKS